MINNSNFVKLGQRRKNIRFRSFQKQIRFGICCQSLYFSADTDQNTYLSYLCASLRFCIESVDCILLSYKDIKYHSWSHYDAVCGKIKHTESKLHEWSVVVKCTFYPSTVMVKKDETATLYHCCCSTLKNKKKVFVISLKLNLEKRLSENS